MTETFTALLFAHILADFVFQPNWMIARKRDPGIFLLHIFAVMALSAAALGRIDAVEILYIGAAHLVIDAVKTYAAPRNLAAFVVDQGAHLLSILAIAAYTPTLMDHGMWAPYTSCLLPALTLIGGAILTIRAGGFAVGLLMRSLTPPEGDEAKGLPRGGQTIGHLERGLIFVLVIAGQPGAIGFLIAAKSILRFGAVQENRAASEYVIIGTLASFSWALTVSFATLWLFDLLGPLEIVRNAP